MGGDDRTADVRPLLTDPVRAAMDAPGYGSWRSLLEPDAALLSFGFPYPGSFPAEELTAATEQLLSEERDSALQYGGGEYADSLRAAVLDRAAERDIACSDDQLLLTNGATHAIDVVCRTFIEPGDPVVVEAPTFMGALKLFRNYGADVEGVALDDDGLDVEALAATLEARSQAGERLPKLVYTIPNFQNPTGVTLTEERRRRLLELAAEYDFLVLEDDPYGEIRFYGEEVPSVAALDDAGRVVRVNTFSKTIAPGVRTGWIIAQAPAIEAMKRVDAGGTNVFTQGVVGRYCAEGHLAEAVPELRREYRRRRDRMIACLDERMPAGVDWSEPDGGFFLWLELPGTIDADAMLPAAIEAGVVYLPGSLFYPDGGGHDRARLSFSYASPAEIERGIEALATTVRAAVRSAPSD